MTWTLFCTARLEDQLDPHLYVMGTVDDEIEAVRLVAAHVEKYDREDDRHLPYIHMQPTPANFAELRWQLRNANSIPVGQLDEFGIELERNLYVAPATVPASWGTSEAVTVEEWF